MGGGLESRCVGRVYGADGAVHNPHQTVASFRLQLSRMIHRNTAFLYTRFDL